MNERWCCRILGAEFGPMEFDELVQLISSGTLGPSDLVRRENEAVWTVARLVIPLKTAFKRLCSTEECSIGEERYHGTGSHARMPLVAYDERQGHSPRPVASLTVNVPDDHAHSDVHEKTPTVRRGLWTCGISLSIVVLLILIDRVVALAIPTFPAPRRIRHQSDNLYWFVGTGPWSAGEWILLWLDAIVLTCVLSNMMARKRNPD